MSTPESHEESSMRVTLLVYSLGMGGAERVLSIIANHWARKGWRVTILTLDGGTVPPFFPLDPQVRHRSLQLAWESKNPIQAVGNNLRRLRQLRLEIGRTDPDAVIAFTTAVNAMSLLALFGLGHRVIVSERTDPVMNPERGLWKALLKAVMPLAHGFVVQTARAVEFYPRWLRPRLSVIPNPLPRPRKEQQREPGAPCNKTVITVGRLCKEKRFDILLEAFAQFHERFPHWRLRILGDGALRGELEARRDRLGLQGCVEMPGSVPDPYVEYRQADIFALSSEIEGFPNALCEAMACGLPAVATDCPTGPREIVRDGENGLLVANRDTAALAEGLCRLAGHSEERERLATQAIDVAERFSVETIMRLWEELL